MWCRPALTSSDASDRLKTITSGRSGGLVRYTFGYDAFGRNTGVTVGNGSTAQTLVTNSFDSRNLLTGVRYGSGSTASYTYDALDRLSQTVYNDVNGSYSYSYTRQGRLCSVEDTVGNFKTVYSYDLAGRLAESTQTRLTSGLDWISSRYEYDEANRLTGYSRTLRILGSTSLSATFGDITKGEDPGKVYALTSNGTRRLEYGYDSLGRLQNTTLHNDYTDFYTLYTYHNTRDGGTTGRVKTIEYRGTNGVSNNDTLTYYYNANGQITSETDSSGKEHSYSYDPLGRLYREDDAKAGTTTAYNYDDRGNIAQKRVYAYTTGILANGTLRDTITYTYGNAVWKDLLTAYDGERITYDAIGNPLSYRNGMTFTWQAGRQMKTATVGNLTYTMQYNQDGIRTGKVQSAGSTTGEETVYYIEDGEILGEYRYNAGVKKLLYQFDANGRRIGFTYNGTQYYYRHNLQGDVIAIVDRNADTVAKYTYDAWGKVLSVTNASGAAQTGANFIGNINPIRYRGYYYDTDLGLYYLQSRYYDPETGRFVNGDNIVPRLPDTMQDYNLYAYCADDPVNNDDPTGQFSSSITLKDIEDFSLNGYCVNGFGYVKKAFDVNGVRYGNGYCRMGDMGNYLLYCAQKYERQYYRLKRHNYEERYNAGSNNYGYEYYNPSTKSSLIHGNGSWEHFQSITVPENNVTDSYTQMEPYDPSRIKRKDSQDTGFIEIFPNVTV